MATDPRATFPDFVDSHDLLPIVHPSKLRRWCIHARVYTSEYERIYDRLFKTGLTFRDWSLTWFEGSLTTLRSYYSDAQWHLLYPVGEHNVFPVPYSSLIPNLEVLVDAWQQWRVANDPPSASYRDWGIATGQPDQWIFWTSYVTCTMCQLDVGRMTEKILHLQPLPLLA